MDRIPVTSSNLVSVGYDSAERVLEVEFSSGVYRYFDVPAETHAAMMAAPSVGSFLHREIKLRYRCEKAEPAAVSG